MKKHIATLLLTALCIAGTAQKNFLPGYIVLPGKDTLKGMVDYRAWEKNPVSVLFQAPSSESRVYPIGELEAFGVDGMDHYRKATVSIDRNPVRVSDVSTYQNGLIATETVLLRILVKGDKLNLYEYVDFKPHYYTGSPGGPIEELGYKVMQDASGGVKFYYDYRNQLKKLLSSQGQLTLAQSQQIDKLEYKEKDLARFVSAINGLQAPPATANKKNRAVFFAGAGIVITNFKFHSGDIRLNSMKFNNTISYIVTGGVDIPASRNLQHLILRAELSVSELRAKGSGESQNTSTVLQKNEYSIRQVNITPSVSLLYHFLNQEKAKVYGGVGAGYNFSTYPEHLFTVTSGFTPQPQQHEDYPALEKAWIGVYARLGVIVFSKLDIGLGAMLSGSYAEGGRTGMPVSFCIRYRFN